MDQTTSYQALCEERRNYWKKQVCDWQQTGLSVSEYCRENGLNQHQFKYWQYQFAPQTRKSKKAIQRLEHPTFIPVTIAPKPQSSAPVFVLHLGTKCRLEITSMDPVAWLTPLLPLLMEG